jgi:hypothetical protein
MNRGIANCALLFNNGDFNTAVTHEVGHTLGFRHSDQTRADNPNIPCSNDPSLECSSSAVMKAFVTQGINAALQPWDQHAVQAVYGSACGTGRRVRSDFDGDKKADVLWRNSADGRTLIWYMNGTTVARGSAARVVDPSFSPTVGDFNGDGLADIVWYNPANSTEDFWILNGTMTISAERAYLSFGAPWQIAAAADFNGDGKDDILWRNASTGRALIWYMNGTTVTNGSAMFGPDASWTLHAGDFNGDGKADVVWYNPSNSTTDFWIFNGGPTITASRAYLSFGAPWTIAAIADFDGDGKDDVLWRNTSTGQSLVWYMNSTTVARGSGLFGPDSTWTVNSGDFSGDSKADVMWYQSSSSTEDFWILNGSPPTISSSRAYVSFGAPWVPASP